MIEEVLLKEIKSKKQIEDLDDEFVLEKIRKFLLTNGDLSKKLKIEFEKNKEKISKNKYFKEVVKRVREEIGIVYGSFLTQDFKKKEKLLEEKNDLKSSLEILKIHKSTRERFDFYKEVYSKIFDWYKPKSIADLSCGIKPISYAYIFEELDYFPSYFASDLNKSDMDFLNEYFQKFKINGIAKNYDMTKEDIFLDKNFKRCDLIFLFKALDSLEFVKKNISKEIILKLKNKKIVVSFPTKSLVSKKEVKSEKRNWFVNFLNKENLSFETFEIENEFFYLITMN